MVAPLHYELKTSYAVQCFWSMEVYRTYACSDAASVVVTCGCGVWVFLFGASLIDS